jgi:CO/xanthine dehydrogenase Mo-binding subunit
MAGNAILGAAQLALKKWQDEERPAIATYQYRPPKTTALDPETGRGEPNFTYGYVAQAVEVEVDIETGHIHLTKVVSTHDVGKAVNPELIVGQIEGGVVQAHGYAIMEHLQSVNGRIINPYLSTYLIPTVLDVPTEVKSVILECADPLGPWGIRGMAEMPMLTLAPAIAAAVYDATGVWLDSLPMIPDRVVATLRQHQVGVS